MNEEQVTQVESEKLNTKSKAGASYLLLFGRTERRFYNFKTVSLLIIICAILPISSFSQNQWTLKKCIDYALENNLDIKQGEIATKSNEINLKSSKLNMLPDLNGNIGQNFSFGRSTSSDGLIVNQNANSTSFGLSSSMPLFDGLKIYNQIKSNKLNLQASLEDLNQAKDNISLNITSQYLQILFNKELYKITLDQIELSKKQVERTEQLVNAGSQPAAELYESKAVLAKDQFNAVQQMNEVRLSLLALTQLLDIKENIAGFDIVIPEIEGLIKLELLNFVLDDKSLNDLSAQRPEIKAAEYRLKASEKDLSITKSTYYPSLNLYGSYGTGYYSSLMEQMLNPSSGVMPLKRQLDVNQQLSISLGLSIPIFNRMTTYYNVRNAKLNILSKQLDLENSRKIFFNEIQKAYYNAIAAGEKLVSSQEAQKASEEAFRYASEKYAAGKSSVYEFEDAKSRLMKANSENAQAKYDFIFRCKILDFYNGKPLEL